MHDRQVVLRARSAAAFLALSALCLSSAAQEKIPPKAEKPANDRPAGEKAKPGGVLSLLAKLEEKAVPLARKFQQAIRAGDLKEAERICRQWTADVPESPDGYYNLGCVQALRGQSDAAFASLAQ